MVARRKHVPARMMLDEFLCWDAPDRSGRLWQLVDGDPVAMAPGSLYHGAIQAEIGGLIRNHLLQAGSACRVIVTPGVVPRTGANRNYRIPDLGVTCVAVSADMIMREPVLLIEILSPSNESETRSNVWTYTTIPSVREILTVRSTRIEAELLRRQEAGGWPDDPVLLTGDTVLRLDSIGFEAPLSAFYRTTDIV